MKRNMFSEIHPAHKRAHRREMLVMVVAIPAAMLGILGVVFTIMVLK